MRCDQPKARYMWRLATYFNRTRVIINAVEEAKYVFFTG
jgi:hypothetical protein